MRALDKNKFYDLSELTSEEYRTLYNWLLKNCNGWQYVSFEGWKNNNFGFNLKHDGSNWSMQEVKPTHNAKELFYTLENIQVDCRELSEEQIKEMCEVFIKNGYDYYNTKSYAIKIDGQCVFMQCDEDDFLIDSVSEEKTTITYEKFMELFSIKEENFKKLVEVLNEELTEEYNNSQFKQIANSLADLLEYKNKMYGNSALEPLNIFNNKCKVGQRLDDKLARIKNSNELRKNDICDLIGYLILTCKENNWTNFDEFKD